MAISAAELLITLKARDDASAVLKKVSGELTGLDKSGAAAGKGIASLSGAFKVAGAAAAGITVAVAGVAALGAALAPAVSSAIDFEQAMSGIKAVSGASGEQMKQLSSLALDLGKSTSFSAREAADGISELVKGGVSIGDVFGGAASAALDLAAAGGVSVGEAATIAANAMNQFSLKGADMAHVSDLVAGAANASSISVSDFNQSLAAGGSVAAMAGQSIDSFATAVALMGAQGIKGSDAGTSLKAALNNLIPTTDTATAKMRELGLITANGTNQFINAQGGMKSFGEIAEVLQTQTAGLTESQRLLALELIFGSDGMRAAGVLAQQGGEGFAAMGEAMLSAGGAAEIARERLNNAAGDIEQLKGSLETAAITVGSLFLPAVRSIAQTATSAVNTAVDEFNTLRASAENIAGAHGIGLIPAALTAVELRIGEVFGSGAQAAFHSTRTAVEDLAAGFEYARDRAGEMADRVSRELTPALEGASRTAAGAGPIFRELADAFDAAGAAARPLTVQFADYLVQQGLVSDATAELSGKEQQHAAVLEALWSVLRNNPISEAIDAFTRLGTEVQRAQTVTADAATATDAAWQRFIAGAGAVRDQVVAKLEELTSFISSLPGRFAEDGAAAGVALVTGIVSNLSPGALVQAALTMIGTAIDGARGAAAAQSPSVGAAIAQGMAGGIAGGAGGVVNAAVGLATRAIAAAKAALGVASPSKEFEAIGEDVDQGFIDGVEGMAAEVEQSVADLMGGAAEAAQTAAEDGFAGLATVLGAQFEKTFTLVEQAQNKIDNDRDQAIRQSQRAAELAERQHQRRLIDLDQELGAARGDARKKVLEKIAQAHEDAARKVEDIETRLADTLDEIAFDSADRLAAAAEKQALLAGEALRDFQRGVEEVQRDTARAAEAISRKAGEAVSDAMRDAADAIIEARTRADEAIADLEANQTLSRDIRGRRDEFSAGQDAESRAFSEKREDADLDYRLKKDLEDAKQKLGRDRAKAETDEERRQADVRYAESVEDLRRGFDDAKKDLARRRQLDEDERAFRKQQQQALQAFNDALEDQALQRQVKRIQDERDSRITEIHAALDEKIAAVRQNEKEENEALRKSADEKLNDLRERFYDKVGKLNAESKDAFEALFAAIKQGVDDAAASVQELADALARTANTKVATPAGSGQTWANQTQAVRDMFTANWGANAQARWEQEHAAEIQAQQSSGGGGGGGSAPAQTSDVHAPGFDWGAYNAANQGKPRNPDGTVKSAYGNPLSAGQISRVGETGWGEYFVPSTAGRLVTQNQVAMAAEGGQHGGGGGYWAHGHDIVLDGVVVGRAVEPYVSGAQAGAVRLELG